MKTTEAFTRGENLIGSILSKMFGIDKWQKDFMLHIFVLCLSMKGRFNFLQMEREGIYSEQTYRNNYKKPFDFMEFNQELISENCGKNLILGFDPSFIEKSGKCTSGLGYFYSGVAKKYKKGLEIGCLGVVDLDQNTAYHLESIQTPAAKKSKLKDNRTLVDHYTELIIERAPKLLNISNLLVVDGYFAKSKFVNGITKETDLRIVCRLRDDANLWYLYKGPKENRCGRPRKYAGKVDTNKIDKRRMIICYSDEKKIIYSCELFSKSLKRNIKVSYVEFLNEKSEIVTKKFYFSTDLQMPGLDIFTYYSARFQVEYLFRDAKQFCGLQHCQARDAEKLDFHFNTCLTTVSIGKVLLRHGTPKTERKTLSIFNITIEFQNRNFMKRIFLNSGIDPNIINIHKNIRKLLDFGKIAA